MPVNRIIHTEEALNLLTLLREQKINISAPCGGYQKCGKCKVMITLGNDHDYHCEEMKLLTKEERDLGIRLACCVETTKDMVVMVMNEDEEKTVTTTTLHDENMGTNAVGNLSINKHSKEVGIVVDIGTTSIEVVFFDLNGRYKLISLLEYNEQRSADVVSRITYCYGNQERVKRLQSILLSQIIRMVMDGAKKLSISITQIVRYVIAGNTVMCHLFANKSLDSLAKAPYRPEYLAGEEMSARQLKLPGREDTLLYILPIIGGHVGADALACLLAIKNHGGCRLLVDIGTNGEILLIKEDIIVACSTAAGPAFEGAGLNKGMCAKEGAIIHANLVGGKLVYQVVANHTPIGISGSGVIDVIACLLRGDFITPDGYFKQGEILSEFVNQADIRQVQLAKAAIAAGIDRLLSHCEVRAEDLDEFILAGSFGSNLSIDSATQIGLIPKLPKEKIHAIGNGVVEGAVQVLYDMVSLSKAKELARKVVHIELSNESGFPEKFVECMNFPI